MMKGEANVSSVKDEINLVKDFDYFSYFPNWDCHEKLNFTLDLLFMLTKSDANIQQGKRAQFLCTRHKSMNTKRGVHILLNDSINCNNHFAMKM